MPCNKFKITEKLNDLKRFEKRIYFISNKRSYAANMDEKSLISFETQDAVNSKRIIYWAEKKKKKKKKKGSESLDKKNQRQHI